MHHIVFPIEIERNDMLNMKWCYPDLWASSGPLRPGRTLMAAIINDGVKYIISDIPEYEKEV